MGFKQVNPKSTLTIHWKDWCWSWSSNTLATWCEESTHWKRPWCWERLQVEEKGMTEDEMVGWHHQLNRHESEQLWEIVRDREVRHAAIHGVAKSRTRLSDWTTTLSEDISYQDLRDVLFLFSIYFCLFIWSQLWRAGSSIFSAALRTFHCSAGTLSGI